MFDQANDVERDVNIAEAMVKVLAAAAADRATVESRIVTVQRIIAKLIVINAQLVSALVANTTLTATVSAASHNRPRGRGGGRGRLVLSRVGDPTGRHYCWSCFDHYYHSDE